MLVRLLVCALGGLALHVAVSAWLAFGTKSAVFEAAALGRERMRNVEPDDHGEHDAAAHRVFTGRLWISGFFASRGTDIVTSHDNGPPVLEVVEYRAGWPWRCWRATAERSAPTGTAWQIHGGLNTNRTIDLNYGNLTGLGVPRRTALPAVVPWQPVWSPLFSNVGLMTVPAAVLWLVPWLVRRALRARRGQCPACAYPIGSSDRCSECGTVVKARTLAA